jgi:hypothetical protein
MVMMMIVGVVVAIFQLLVVVVVVEAKIVPNTITHIRSRRPAIRAAATTTTTTLPTLSGRTSSTHEDATPSLVPVCRLRTGNNTNTLHHHIHNTNEDGSSYVKMMVVDVDLVSTLETDMESPLHRYFALPGYPISYHIDNGTYYYLDENCVLTHDSDFENDDDNDDDDEEYRVDTTGQPDKEQQQQQQPKSTSTTNTTDKEKLSRARRRELRKKCKTSKSCSYSISYSYSYSYSEDEEEEEDDGTIERPPPTLIDDPAPPLSAFGRVGPPADPLSAMMTCVREDDMLVTIDAYFTNFTHIFLTVNDGSDPTMGPLLGLTASESLYQVIANDQYTVQGCFPPLLDLQIQFGTSIMDKDVYVVFVLWCCFFSQDPVQNCLLTR